MKTVLIIVILFLLYIVWVALHDIIKGAESLTAEYIALIVSVVLLPVLIFSLLRKFRAAKK